MREYTIGSNEAGQRLDKYLAKLLNGAPPGFFYRMLRKKNITLNAAKAAGSEHLKEGDQIRLYLSDETIRKFQVRKKTINAHLDLDILYEDPDVIFLNKPSGILSQPDASGAPSMTDYLLDWMMSTGEVDETSLQTFRPAVCNRLDRNTSGILLAGRSLAGLQGLSEALRERTVHKDYLCLVFGRVDRPGEVKGYLTKDAVKNKVTVRPDPVPGASFIHTVYSPLAHPVRGDSAAQAAHPARRGSDAQAPASARSARTARSGPETTLLKVRLITGKTHQIRAHLASEGHPLVGDVKYGGPARNRYYQETYGLTSQLLHSWRVSFETMEPALPQLSGLSVQAPLPAPFRRILEKEYGKQCAAELAFEHKSV